MIDSNLYEKARADKVSRLEFLRGVDMEEFSPFVRSVSYRPRFLNNRMTTISPPATSRSPAPKSWVIVSDRAFGLYSVEEFYNTLVHHEGRHAKDKYYDPLLISGILLSIKDVIFHRGNKVKLGNFSKEFWAYSSQIDHESFSLCTPWFQKEAVRRRDFYGKEVERLQSLLK